MIDHVSITASDIKKAEDFYDAVMATLGYPCVYKTEQALGYGTRNSPEDDGNSYVSVLADGGVVVSRRHWAFQASSRDAVDLFCAAHSRQMVRTTARPKCSWNTILITMQRSSPILTATGSKPSAILR
jgi:catechol 2,3-dioxygenase-like lactoylglutathione lyase family enzyme